MTFNPSKHGFFSQIFSLFLHSESSSKNLELEVGRLELIGHCKDKGKIKDDGNNGFFFFLFFFSEIF